MSDLLEEHYSYLSDGIRRQRFEGAVTRAIRPGDSVADIGCGIGILGLLCLKAGAAQVWGIDRTDAIEIARETMRRAGLEERYSCIRGESRRVTLPQRVDVVICDHVGYFGFDYGIIETFSDARRRFLKPGGKVIPGAIVLETAGIMSENCRSLAEAWGRDPIPAELHWLRSQGVNSKHAYSFSPAEVATTATDLGIIDLRADCPDHYAFSARLEAARDGQLHGLGGWFRCELAEGVEMTNSPLAPGRIKRSQVFLPFDEPLDVVAGDTVVIAVSLRHKEGLLSWKAAIERTGQSARQSNWASTILHPRDQAVPEQRVPRLNAEGQARKSLLDRVDGRATAEEIERAMLRDHPDLFPSAEEISRFARTELTRSAE